MSNPWYVTLAELISHLPLFAGMTIAYMIRRKSAYAGILFIQQLLILFCSVFYHTCAETGYCLFGAAVYVWQQIDNINAFNGIDVVLLAFITTAMVYERVRDDQIFWVQVTAFAVYSFTVIVVLTSITGPQQEVGVYGALIVFSFAISVAFLKLIYVDKGVSHPIGRFADWRIWLGLVLLLIGVVCFVLEYPGYEWITHSLWHLFAFTGIDFILYGLMAHLPDVSSRSGNRLSAAQ